MINNIHIIINPSSGKAEPVLALINKVFEKSGINWDISVTKKAGDAFSLAKAALEKNVDLIGIYGGDGSVVEVAEALCGEKTPLAIIPGGTANVMAKELKIPVETQAALEMLKNGSYLNKKVDMGKVNDRLFLVRINAGFVADMITETDGELKDKLGQLAYGITAVKHLAKSETVDYVFNIDGEEVKASGVAMIIANSGNVGFSGMSYVPDIDVSDGLLDVIIIKSADAASIVTMAGSALAQKKPENVLSQWKGKRIEINMPEGQTLMIDDAEVKTRQLAIEIIPGGINILAPDDINKTENSK